MSTSGSSIKVSIGAVLIAGILLGFFAGRLSIDLASVESKGGSESNLRDSIAVAQPPSPTPKTAQQPTLLTKPNLPQPGIDGSNGANKFAVSTGSAPELKVGRVIDGDTVEVHYRPNEPIRERVRLLRIDTPERGQRLYGEAKAELDLLMASGKARLEFEPNGPKRDKYGRLLVYIFIDDKLVNVEMVRRGLSKHYTRFGTGVYESQFKNAEAEAQSGKLGLWAPVTSSP